MSITRQFERVVDITVASGDNTIRVPLATFDANGLVLADVPFNYPRSGRVINASARLLTGGGWTFSAIQLRVGRPVFNGIGQPAVVSLWSSYPKEQLIYESAVVVPVASATDPFAQAAFYDKQQGWFRDFMVGLQWTTSAGAGTSQVRIAVDYIDDESC